MALPDDVMQAVIADMLAAWPQTKAWADDVWEAWADQLARFTAAELRDAVHNVARRGDSFPPGWGVVFYEAYWKCGGRNRILAKVQREEIAKLRADD